MTARRTVSILAAGVLGISGCQAKPEFTAQDEAEIRAMFDATPGYFVSGNFEPWADQFGASGVLQPPNGPAVSGRAELLSWAKAFPPMAKAGFLDVQVVGDGNMAYGTSAYVLTTKDSTKDSGKQLVVARKSAEGKWELAVVSFSSDLPLPAPAAAGRSAKK